MKTNEGECQHCGRWAKRCDVWATSDYGAGLWLCPECVRTLLDNILRMIGAIE